MNAAYPPVDLEQFFLSQRPPIGILVEAMPHAFRLNKDDGGGAGCYGCAHRWCWPGSVDQCADANLRLLLRSQLFRHLGLPEVFLELLVFDCLPPDCCCLATQRPFEADKSISPTTYSRLKGKVACFAWPDVEVDFNRFRHDVRCPFLLQLVRPRGQNNPRVSVSVQVEDIDVVHIEVRSTPPKRKIVDSVDIEPDSSPARRVTVSAHWSDDVRV